eukprot:1062805-Pelagomonas_calceolata.AAC.1
MRPMLQQTSCHPISPVCAGVRDKLQKLRIDGAPLKKAEAVDNDVCAWQFWRLTTGEGLYQRVFLALLCAPVRAMRVPTGTSQLSLKPATNEKRIVHLPQRDKSKETMPFEGYLLLHDWNSP